MEENPPGPAQEKVAPGAAEPPLKVTVGAVQVSAPPAAVAPGDRMSWITIAVALEVQPVAGLVTTTV